MPEVVDHGFYMKGENGGRSRARRSARRVGGRWLPHLLSQPFLGRTVRQLKGNTVMAGDVLIDVSDPLVSDRNVARMYFGLYEGAELRLVRRWVADSAQIIELGASLGVTGRNAIWKLGRAGEVVRYVGVEANPHLAGRLEKTVHKGFNVKTCVLNAAVNYRSGPIYYREGSATEGGTVESEPPGVEVRSISLSEVVAEELITGQPYVLICDIEGLEFELFQKDGGALAMCSLAIVEVHRAGAETASEAVERFRRIAGPLGFVELDRQGRVLVLGRRAVSGELGGNSDG